MSQNLRVHLEVELIDELEDIIVVEKVVPHGALITGHVLEAIFLVLAPKLLLLR
jgi:hypothetical protein